MTEDSPKLPRFDSIDALVEFTENNDMAPYLGALPEVEFAVHSARRSLLIQVETDQLEKLSAVARSKNTSSSELLNDWIREKLAAS